MNTSQKQQALQVVDAPLVHSRTNPVVRGAPTASYHLQDVRIIVKLAGRPLILGTAGD
jgi:hypothetical protein